MIDDKQKMTGPLQILEKHCFIFSTTHHSSFIQILNFKMVATGDLPGGSVVKNLPVMHGTWVRSLVRELRSQTQGGS